MTANVVGNYKLVEKIGQGGMGAVYRGVDLMLEREVAIKVLRPELAGNPEILERFRTEAVTLAKLNHPNIATLYAFFRQGDDFFMVMEFVRGETLDHAIQRAGAMRVDTAVPVFCQALEGIGYAHKLGIVHRDIKPANMMLTPDGSIKVMDFGIARVLGSARMTKQGNIIGTIEYMSPEQVRGLETDARSDIYSLGILLYEMVTGRVPFASDSEFDLMKAQIDEPPPPPRQFAPHVPEMVEQAIMRSLAKMPEARFQTAGEFRNMLMSGAAAAEAPTRLQTAPPGVKETRLGAPVPTQPVTGQMKETRMAGAGTAQAYQPVPAFDFPPPTPRQPSLFARMTWKHYTAAALFLVVLMAVPFAVLLIAGGGNSPNPQPSANRTNSPTGASSTPSTGAQTGTSSTEQPVTSVERVPAPPPAVAPAGQLPGDTALGSAEPPSDKPAKTKDKKAADAAAREKARKKAAAERALDN
jgi:serine/threonine-protein kinase